MVDVEAEARAAAGGRPLEHLQVAIGVAECGNGAAADVLLDGDGLAVLVVEEMQFREFQEDGLAVAQLELLLAAAADDLLGRWRRTPWSGCDTASEHNCMPGVCRGPLDFRAIRIAFGPIPEGTMVGAQASNAQAVPTRAGGLLLGPGVVRA